MPAVIKLDTRQVKEIINQLDDKEKTELAAYLDSLTLRQQWKNFISKGSTCPLTIEEVTEEVEKVRSERYL